MARTYAFLCIQVCFHQVAVINRMHLMGGMTSSCYVRSFMLLQSNTSDVWLAYQETDGVDKVSGYRTLNNTLLESNTVLSELNTVLSE